MIEQVLSNQQKSETLFRPISASLLRPGPVKPYVPTGPYMKSDLKLSNLEGANQQKTAVNKELCKIADELISKSCV